MYAWEAGNQNGTSDTDYRKDRVPGILRLSSVVINSPFRAANNWGPAAGVVNQHGLSLHAGGPLLPDI